MLGRDVERSFLPNRSRSKHDVPFQGKVSRRGPRVHHDDQMAAPSSDDVSVVNLEPLDLRVRSQCLVLHQRLGNVDSEAIHSTVEPEFEDGIELGSDTFVLPVQIRLLRQEEMEVVLAGGVIERPSGPSEEAHPVVWRATVGTRISPDVVVSVGMLVSSVRDQTSYDSLAAEDAMPLGENRPLTVTRCVCVDHDPIGCLPQLMCQRGV